MLGKKKKKLVSSTIPTPLAKSWLNPKPVIESVTVEETLLVNNDFYITPLDKYIIMGLRVNNVLAGCKLQYQFCERKQWRLRFAWPRHKVALHIIRGKPLVYDGCNEPCMLTAAIQQSWRIVFLTAKMVYEHPQLWIQPLRQHLFTPQTIMSSDGVPQIMPVYSPNESLDEESQSPESLESSVLQDFLLQLCKFDVKATTPTQQLYAAYKKWASELNIPVLSLRVFGKELGKLGLQVWRTQKYRGWKGIKLIHEV